MAFFSLNNVQVSWYCRSTEAKPGRIRPMYCLDAKYMTCPPKDTEQLPPACNCCLAENEKRGCTIYLSNGGVEKCGA